MSVDITHLTTFKTVACARAVIYLKATEQLATLTDVLDGPDFIVIGEGSNILFADDYDGTLIVNQLKGVRILSEDDEHARVWCAAGESWHDTVCDMSARGLYGLENLALIPGTVGAAPVQNIGAYGVEVADLIESVTIFDLQSGCMVEMSAVDCAFAYRDSVFKTDESRRRFIITGVTLCLSKHFNPVLTYQGLSQEPVSTAAELLERVIAVRKSKLPDPHVLPNAGSFFKNPIVRREQLEIIQERYPQVTFFNVDAEHVKIPAAWLLQTAGFKGVSRDNGAGVYERHALILVNRGHAHGREIYALACDMMQEVERMFGVAITPEVRILGIHKKH